MNKVYKIENKNGYSAEFFSVGCVIRKLNVKDKDGNIVDVVLGFDEAKNYANQNRDENPFLGAIVGRIAGRIGNSKFSLNGKEYKLKPNFGEHHLHGILSFAEWDAKVLSKNSVQFHHVSKSMSNGYPCDLDVFITYTFTDENEFIIDYKYTNLDDKLETIVNLTNHSYFNLSGYKEKVVKNHMLQINSEKVTECDDMLIPSGKMLSVEGTKHDFRKLKKIETTELDICYEINPKDDFNAKLLYPKNGVEMKVKTTFPGLVCYDSVAVKGLKGKDKNVYDKFAGICFECQYYPDSINHSNFPSIVVKPKETKNHQTIFKFCIKK